ncbi:putative signal transducing protein [Paraglaciecola hydrolytica]|uniref:RanBP2-type domain-containing protein n=1 Tax=Paraglaciecola hydrolytica TaxID=1799789 RepID=A0A135ZZ37_9ALTE|nr:DUF2007 domain-containing protein [Paraglaciecola hydrolytica]KXI28248.1 hypothetical protein AX660_17885 [Paraglaciecola hydrolytica]
MKMVYTNESNILVNSAKNMLVHNGLSVSVKNEHNSTGGHVLLANMELWVNHDADYLEAMKLLSKLDSRKTSEEWTCSECNEKNDVSFEICWNCRSEAVPQA